MAQGMAIEILHGAAVAGVGPCAADRLVLIHTEDAQPVRLLQLFLAQQLPQFVAGIIFHLATQLPKGRARAQGPESLHWFDRKKSRVRAADLTQRPECQGTRPSSLPPPPKKKKNTNKHTRTQKHQQAQQTQLNIPLLRVHILAVPSSEDRHSLFCGFKGKPGGSRHVSFLFFVSGFFFGGRGCLKETHTHLLSKEIPKMQSASFEPSFSEGRTCPEA